MDHRSVEKNKIKVNRVLFILVVAKIEYFKTTRVSFFHILLASLFLGKSDVLNLSITQNINIKWFDMFHNNENVMY